MEGAAAVLERYPEAVTIFIRPSSIEDLRKRLEARGTENPEQIERRLEVARREWRIIDRYDHEVINDDVDDAVEKMCEILDRANP